MLYWDSDRVWEEERRNHRIFGPNNLAFVVHVEQ